MESYCERAESRVFASVVMGEGLQSLCGVEKETLRKFSCFGDIIDTVSSEDIK